MVPRSASKPETKSGPSTKDWVRRDGKRMVDMSKWPPEQLDGKSGLRARTAVSGTPGGEQQAIKAGQPFWQ